MRRLVLAILLLSIPSVSAAQKPRMICRGDRCVMTQTGTDPNQVHQIANDFEREVTSKLNTGQLLRVTDPRVRFWTWMQNGRRYYQIEYSVRLLLTLLEKAHVHFARRGTWMFGSDRASIQRYVDSEQFKKQQELWKLHGMWTKQKETPQTRCYMDYSESIAEGIYGYLQECFVVDKDW